MAITPINNTVWDDEQIVQNGESGDSANLSRAVSTLRGELQEVWTKLWGAPGNTSTDTPTSGQQVSGLYINGGAY